MAVVLWPARRCQRALLGLAVIGLAAACSRPNHMFAEASPDTGRPGASESGGDTARPGTDPDSGPSGDAGRTGTGPGDTGGSTNGTGTTTPVDDGPPATGGTAGPIDTDTGPAMCVPAFEAPLGFDFDPPLLPACGEVGGSEFRILNEGGVMPFELQECPGCDCALGPPTHYATFDVWPTASFAELSDCFELRLAVNLDCELDGYAIAVDGQIFALASNLFSLPEPFEAPFAFEMGPDVDVCKGAACAGGNPPGHYSLVDARQGLELAPGEFVEVNSGPVDQILINVDAGIDGLCEPVVRWAIE